MDKITKQLEARKEAYISAKTRADVARREETAALNNLNEAQKAFDKAVDAARANAPYLSDWANRGRGV